MENSFQTSFIPKKPIISASTNNEPKSLFLIIAIFLLVVSIAASAFLFFYKSYLNKKTESSSVVLSEVKKSFEKNTIEELDLFNKRTETAKQVLTKHTVMSPMFILLGETAVPQVQYTKFDQQNDKEAFNVKIKGAANDYRSIAIQAKVFSSEKGRYFKNVVFSNLEKDEKTNKIGFDLELTVDPELLSYEKSISLMQTQTPDNTLPSTNPLPQDLENKTQ